MPVQDGEYGCPVEVGLQLVSGRWKPRIMYELLNATRRFGELLRLVPGISRHVLTVQLRELQRHGIVTRTQYVTVPPKVEYSLTSFGRRFAPIFEQLIEIGEDHIARDRDQAADI